MLFVEGTVSAKNEQAFHDNIGTYLQAVQGSGLSIAGVWRNKVRKPVWWGGQDASCNLVNLYEECEKGDRWSSSASFLLRRLFMEFSVYGELTYV